MYVKKIIYYFVQGHLVAEYKRLRLMLRRILNPYCLQFRLLLFIGKYLM